MDGTEAVEDDEGNRIFKIQLPNGKMVEATVDPSLKMMDLLISIASTNKLNPTAFQIAQPSKIPGRPPNVYTPSQSAGDIDGRFIMLIPKKEREQFSINKGKKSGVFEHTVRLTVHSSKNHKMIFRTNPEKTLGEVFPKICEERGVETSHYVMRVHKRKEDADLTQTIQSFGVLDFDLVEMDNDSKKKGGFLGKLKKKRTEKNKPTANGSHPKHETHPPESKVQRQNSDGAVPHKPDGGVPHKKRPAPLPPSQPAANTQPSDVQAKSNTLEKTKPKISRVSTKKRKAPAAPVAVVPINIDESQDEKKETNGENGMGGVGDPSQRVGSHDETDAPSQGVGGHSMEVGHPPSPSVSHGSSQGLSTSDKDRSSVTGSFGEQENQGSIPPSKPPRLNFYSDDEIDAELNVKDKPVFIPPSPPLTPPSASVPTEDVRKLIAEGRLSIEEDYPDGDASTNPDSSSVHDEEQFTFEESLAADNQSLDDLDGVSEISLAKIDGPEVKDVVSQNTASTEKDEKQKSNVSEVSSSDMNSEENLESVVGTLPGDVPPPPYIEQVPPPPMPPSPPPPLEGENLPTEDDLLPPPPNIPPPPPGEDPPRRVCKCIDPENGEDCDHLTPGAIRKEGEDDDGGCPYARNNSDNDRPPPPDGDGDGTQDRRKNGGDQPPPGNESKDVFSPLTVLPNIPPSVKQKLDLSPKSNIVPKPKRFSLRKEYAHPLENRLSFPRALDLELTEALHENVDYLNPRKSKVEKMLDGYVKQVHESKSKSTQQLSEWTFSEQRISKTSDSDLSSPQIVEFDVISQEKSPASPPPTKQKPVISPKPYIVPKPKRFSLKTEVAHPLDNRLSFPRLTDVKLTEVDHGKTTFSDPRRRFFSEMFIAADIDITPKAENITSKPENITSKAENITSKAENISKAKNGISSPENSASEPEKTQLRNTTSQPKSTPKLESIESITVKPENAPTKAENITPKAVNTTPKVDNDAPKSDNITSKENNVRLSENRNSYPENTSKTEIITQKQESSIQSSSGDDSKGTKTQSEIVEMNPGDKDAPRPPGTLALKRSFDDDSNETTSYSATPQEEDIAHEMEDKSLQLAMAASLLAKEEQNSGKDKKKDESKSEVETQGAKPEKDSGKPRSTYQMQTDSAPEDVQDLKTMYLQMQTQLMELQQKLLTNQGAAQQQPAALQLQQLQQLQQQMLLQQQLLLQQGMMMPPVVMQTSPPQMMVSMTPQPMMVAQGMQQPYVMPQQPPVMMMQPSVGVAQPAEQSLPSGAGVDVNVSPSANAEGDKTLSLGADEKDGLSKKEGSLEVADKTESEEEKAELTPSSQPTITQNEKNTSDSTPTPGPIPKEPVAEGLHGTGTSDIDTTSTRTELAEVGANGEDPSLSERQTVSPKAELADGSPSTRRKNVFADILKKKGKQSVKTNYVLSAQREMLNRQRSGSDARMKSTTPATLASDDARPRSGSDLPSKPAVSAVYEGESVKGTEILNSNSENKDVTTAIKVENSVKPVRDSPVFSRDSLEIKGEILKTDGEIPDKNAKEAIDSSKRTTDVSTEKSQEESTPHEKGDSLVTVTEFEAEFALDTTSKVSPGGDTGVMPTKLNNGNVPVEAKSVTSELPPKAPPKVAPKPALKPPSKPPPHRQDGPRPFRKSTRPVSLASDRQSELQQMAGLSNVSRFKEMMATLKSKESTDA